MRPARAYPLTRAGGAAGCLHSWGGRPNPVRWWRSLVWGCAGRVEELDPWETEFVRGLAVQEHIEVDQLAILIDLVVRIRERPG